MEGVLAEISPETNLVQIASVHIKDQFFQKDNLKRFFKDTGKNLGRSLLRAIDIPSLTADILQGLMKGQTKVNLDLRVSDDFEQLLRRLIRNIVMGLWVMALLISSSIICTTDMHPKLLGIPALGVIGYICAFIIALYIIIRHFLS